MKLLKFYLVFIAVLIAQPSFAQKDSTLVFPDSSKVMNDLYFLASDSLQGRKTNTMGNEIARKYIIQRLQKLGVSAYVQDYTQSFTFGKDMISAVNVLGFIEGYSGEDFIVISAHYDHVGMKDSTKIYNGADDNASGITALLSLAEYFRENQPENNLLFAFFDAEEMGLQGAKHFMQSVVVDTSKIIMNVNLDMVSRGDKNELYVVGTYFTPFLKPLITEAAKDKSIKLLFGRDEPKKKPNWVTASDHAPFHKAKIPFIYFGVDDHPDYHKITDTADKINPDFYLEAIRLIKEAVEIFDANLGEIVYGK
ncbi:aminopeptidase [Marivirga tractuosa]|uniref:Peptidase M28 n=1 Tax=Marivirga tractuosa (strain ATCC 23168 / DSM 4126 / NBRC 15989 / NCIMB 1408 / VKM B-1430 / H-43) TaxID=643867 RepID=E4TN39_MARTH|nr:M20/M25/M40 family metallo-hydrolase [Marivirga tractuosa]ADR22453.1 peptidase M28 [Marivirga tractuosa DSM 4126]BDD16876.1 aminopeptidase [Marivirga tractuosa]